MKVCDCCGEEIGGLDGDNRCSDCERAAADSKRTKRSARAKGIQRAREEALRSCGLVKVRGVFGGVYWE